MQYFVRAHIGAKQSNHPSYESCHHRTCRTHHRDAPSHTYAGIANESRFVGVTRLDHRGKSGHSGRRRSSHGQVAIPEAQSDLHQEELSYPALLFRARSTVPEHEQTKMGYGVRMPAGTAPPIIFPHRRH